MNGGWKKAVEIGVPVLVSFNTVLLAFGLQVAWKVAANHEARLDEMTQTIATIEADRFDAQDGLEVWQEIARIREDMAMKANIEDVPPPEVIRWLERHDREIQDLGR